MNISIAQLGTIVQDTRRAQGLTQADLALSSGTGLRFVSELEQGKESCHIAKVLQVLNALGISIQLTLPHAGPELSDEGARGE